MRKFLKSGLSRCGFSYSHVSLGANLVMNFSNCCADTYSRTPSQTTLETQSHIFIEPADHSSIHFEEQSVDDKHNFA